MTITLKDYMECISYRITEGCEYMWKCYGLSAYQLDSGSSYGENTVSVVFDKETQVVYQMEAWDFANRRSYRWINPDYIYAIKAESKKRNIVFEQSIDNEKFIDIDSVKDMLEKATAIANGEEYDTRVTIELNFEDDELFEMMKMAHEMDLSFNKFVEYILEQAIKHEKNNALPVYGKNGKPLSMTKDAIRKREARRTASRAFGGGW
jgi:hypothetical protein